MPALGIAIKASLVYIRVVFQTLYAPIASPTLRNRLVCVLAAASAAILFLVSISVLATIGAEFTIDALLSATLVLAIVAPVM